MKTLLLICTGCLIAAITQAQIIHVPADYPTIQQGINAATNGDTVLVSDGTYYEQINFHGKKPLMVASQFLMDGDTNHIASTIIDGSQAPNPDSASVVYFITNEDTTSIICGFTIRGGHGTKKNYSFIGLLKAGGGIYCTDGCSLWNNIITENELIENTMSVCGGGIWCNSDGFVRIKENTISHNKVKYTGDGTTWAFGGGICCFDNNYRIKIIQNLISENEVITSSANEGGGGGAFFNFTSIYCANNRFKSNTVTKSGNNAFTYGGGLTLMDYGTGCYIGNNLFFDNYAETMAGGVYLCRPYNRLVVVENNYFINNASTYGGGLRDYNSKSLLQNNVFRGNHAIYGGACCLYKEPLASVPHLTIFINNSFYGNKAYAGGAIYSNKTKPLIFNTIFWADSASIGQEIYSTLIDTIEIAFSNINPAFIAEAYYIDGSGNINENPLYDTIQQLTISPDSPCLNTGTEEYYCNCGIHYICPAYDIIGTYRPHGGFVDMGAYEVGFGTGIKQFIDPITSDWHSVYPNPFTNHAKLNYELDRQTHVEINLYNSSGELIQNMLSEQQEAGKQELQFISGNLPAGIYFYRITTKTRKATGRMILMK
jgi:hypothetical protein